MRGRSPLIGMLMLALGATVFGHGTLQEDPRVAVVRRALQPGEAIRLDVTCQCGDVLPRVVAFGRDVPLTSVSLAGTETLSFGLVAIDLDTRPGVYPVTVLDPQGRAPVRTIHLPVIAKTFPTRRLRVAAAFVDPSASDLERIARDASMLDALLTSVTPRLWDGPFVAPVETRATSNFGTRSIFNGQPRSPHGGVDFDGPVGTPVVAPGAGRIVLADDLFFTGNTILIDHGLGLFSLLAHLSTTTVTTGDLVTRGAMVGRLGATGRVTAPHLHWGIRLNGARVDPLSLLFVTERAGTERR